MTKTETMENASMNEVFRNALPERFNFNGEQFSKDCTTMDIYDQLIGISDKCPVKLNYSLTQAFALLQEKNPNENYIKTLAVFTEMLLVLQLHREFIISEHEKFYAVYEAYESFNNMRNARR